MHSRRRVARWAGRLLPLLLAAALLGQVVAPTRAQDAGPTIVVASPLDAADPAPSDGACAAPATGGRCTLRAAIQTANARNEWAQPVTIELPAATYTLTRTGANEDAGATGDLDIGVPIWLRGPTGNARAVIVAPPGDRVFHILSPLGHPPLAVELSGVGIQGGNGVDYGGGILASSRVKLTLKSCEVEGNRAALAGGGLWLGQDANISYCAIRDNATITGAGDGHGGGGIFAHGLLDILLSAVTNNRSAGHGGGILVLDNGEDRAAVVTHWSTVTTNEAAGEGGGIYAAADIRLDGSTVSGNRARRGGGVRLVERPVSGPGEGYYTFVGAAGVDTAAVQPLHLFGTVVKTVFADNLTVDQPANCDAGVSAPSISAPTSPRTAPARPPAAR